MSRGEREPIPSVSEAVLEAAATCDPNGGDAGVRGMIDAFEDDDRPVTTVDDFEETLASVERGIDPDQDTPAAQMTVAAAIWLSTNPDQEHHHREHVLREASRLYFHGEPPPDVAEWLREAGVG
jgi:hypothetical protein